MSSEIELARAYLSAKHVVLDSAFASEIVWQSSRNVSSVNESEFLAQMAWVILSAGLSYHAVNACFGQISAGFLHWKSAATIAMNAEECVQASLESFRSHRKISCISDSCVLVASIGFRDFWDAVKQDPIESLQCLPGIGTITSHHLAKNLGFVTAKQDRHLERIALVSAHNNAQELCSNISSLVGDRADVVDLVLWRYATLKRDYLANFSV